VALCQARISTKPLWGFSSSNPYHSQSRAEQEPISFSACLQAMSRRKSPLQSALPIQDAKIHEDKKAQQYWRKEHVCANILAEP
jgi:hypothetical protein